MTPAGAGGRKNGDQVVPILLGSSEYVTSAPAQKGPMNLPLAGSGRRSEPAGGFDHLTRPDAPGARSDVTWGPIYHCPHPLQVGVPASVRLVVGVADVVPEDGPFATDFTYSSHRSLHSKVCRLGDWNTANRE